jgi:hypothetical protein
MNWLYRNWACAALFTAVFLLLLTPFWFAAFGLPFTLIFLHLPMYQLHQIEEHYHDRFRIWINTTIGQGLEILTVPATFWINCLAAWGLAFLALYAAWFFGPGWGLAMAYLVLINGVTHIIGAIVQRRYNPGLATSLLLFLPVGGWSLKVLTVAGHATWLQQAVGAGVAIAAHAGIIATVKIQRAKLLAGR